MNHNQLMPDGDASEIQRIERAILAAGNYVRPTDDLRPRTIEAASEHCSDRRTVQKVIGLGLAALVLLMVSVPAVERLRVRRARATSPSSLEIQQQAIEYSVQAGTTPDWGLTKKFDDLRHFQAGRLGRPGS